MQTPTAPKFTRWHILLLKFLKWLITTANIGLIRISKGRLGASFLGVPVLLLTTRGRKTGEPRTLPLYYMTDGERVVMVASNAGTSSDPAWLLNLRATPAVDVTIGDKSRAMLAHEASPEEKDVLWPRLVQLFPKWQMMEDRSLRRFPVVVLEPRPGGLE